MPNPATLFELVAILAIIGIGCWALAEHALTRRGVVVFVLFVAQGALSWVGGVVSLFQPAPASGELSPAWLWLGRASTALFLLAAGLAVLRWLRDPVSRQEPGTALRAAMLFYCLLALGSELVTTGSVRQDLALYTVFFLVAGSDHVAPSFILTWTRRLLMLFVAGSALALVANHPGAWTGELGGNVLPLLELRFQGIRGHPNNLGPYLVLYLLVERMQPTASRLRFPLQAAAVVMLLLTQSKTSWAAAGLVAAVLWSGTRARQRMQQLLIGAALACLVVFVVVAGDMALPEDIDTSTLEGARTLTGRTQIWGVGIDAFRAEPWWGGGPMLYEDYAVRSGKAFAAQAHNQAVQTLGEQGLLGFVGLLLYLLVLCRMAWRHAAQTQWASVALVGIFLIRCLTETPVDEMSFEHLLVFLLVLAWERAAHDRPSPRPDVPVKIDEPVAHS